MKHWRWLLLVASTAGAGCTIGTELPDDAGMQPPFNDAGAFVCHNENTVGCKDNIYHYCVLDPLGGEFPREQTTNCNEVDPGEPPLVCVEALGCALCRPNEASCHDGNVVQCNGTGDDFTIIDECDIEDGEVCQQGQCRNLCQVALQDRSYVGCEFYGVDLDNAAIGAGRDAASQQYSIVVSNPSGFPTPVVVERNIAPLGEEPVLEVIETVTVLPGDLEVLDLPRREVDGSSSFFPCDATAECNTGEACWCAGGLPSEATARAAAGTPQTRRA
jgi:hypothetical protein